MSRKWRPSLWFVLGGGLAGTLALSLAGLVILRYLGPEIGYRQAAILLASIIGMATAILGFLQLRLLLRPIKALAAFAASVRSASAKPAAQPSHFGTREIYAMGHNVIDMAATLQNREATIRSFTDHVSHELKTPVSAIHAATELLEDSSDLTATDRRLVAQIRGASQQMQDQLEALRRVASAREASHHGQTRLDDIAAELASTHPTLEISVTGGGLPIPLSKQGLSIVLGHLLANAATAGASQMQLTATPGPDGLMLHVADNGPGISTGNRPHVFEPFFTTNRDQGGTGMGLAIAANLLRAHGADIALLAAQTGTTFALSFPDRSPLVAG